MSNPFHYSLSELEAIVCRSDCRQPCHLVCDSECATPCPRRNPRWTHDRLLRTLLINQYCQQPAFSTTSFNLPGTIVELAKTGLALPSPRIVLHASKVAARLRTLVGDAAEMVGLELSAALATSFNQRAVVALHGACTLRLDYTTRWGACLMVELHSVFQEDPNKLNYCQLINTFFQTLPIPRWKEAKRSLGFSEPFERNDCVCGSCSKAIVTIENGLRNGGAPSIEQVQIASTRGHLCPSLATYWSGRLAGASSFYERLLRRVKNPLRLPDSTPANILTAIAVLNIDIEAAPASLSVDQCAQVIFAACTSISPRDLGSALPEDGQCIGYISASNFGITYGTWLPELADNSAEGGDWCFVLRYNPPRLTFSLPFNRQESSDHPFYTMHMAMLVPMHPDPPPAAITTAIDINALTPPQDIDVHVHLNCSVAGALEVIAEFGGTRISSNFAPYVHRAKACEHGSPHFFTIRPVIEFKDFIAFPNLNIKEIYIVACTLEREIHEDAATLIAVMAAKWRKRVYLRNRRECVECALSRMRTHWECSVLCV